MKPRIPLFIVSIFLFSLPSLFADSFVLITDKYWNSILMQEYEPGLMMKFSSFIEEHSGLDFGNHIRIGGRRVRLTVLENDSTLISIETLGREINSAAEDSVMLSPYISSSAAELALMFPEKKIIALKAMELQDIEDTQASAENLYRLVWDYEKAFFRAGEYAAELDKPLVAVFYTGTAEYMARYESFIKGFDSVADSPHKDFLKFSNIDDKNIVRKFTEKIGNLDIFSAAVFAGPYNPDILKGEDGLGTEDVLSENTQIWDGAGFNIRGSVELTPLTVIGYGIREFSAKDAENTKKIYADFILY